MTRSVSASDLGLEFNNFLFAAVGEEANGMPLSVLSALARKNVDPWHEAAELARLPRDSSVKKLTALIEELPAASTSHECPRTVATHLVALLPRTPGFEVPAHHVVLGSGAVVKHLSFIYVMALLLSVVFGAELFAIRNPAPPQIFDPHASPAGSNGPAVPFQSGRAQP